MGSREVRIKNRETVDPLCKIKYRFVNIFPGSNIMLRVRHAAKGYGFYPTVSCHLAEKLMIKWAMTI